MSGHRAWETAISRPGPAPILYLATSKGTTTHD